MLLDCSEKQQSSTFSQPICFFFPPETTTCQFLMVVFSEYLHF